MLSTPPLSARLRTATRALHAQTEELVDPDHWLSSRQRYAAHLRRLETLWRSVDGTFGDRDAMFRIGRAICGTIRLDLASLGENARPVESVDLSGLATADDARLRGVGYVLFGSRLGGAVLARRARESLGADLPVRALTDPSISEHWQNARRWIDAVGTGNRAVLDATRGAIATFRRCGELLAPDGLVGTAGFRHAASRQPRPPLTWSAAR